VSGRHAVGLVARREIVERAREKSFLVSAVINIVIVVAVILLSAVLGGEDEYVVGFTGDRTVAEAAQRTAAASDVTVELREVSPAAGREGLEDGSLDAVLTGDGIEAQEDVEDDLLTFLQAGNREVRAAEALAQAGVTGEQAQQALSPPPLEVASLEPVDEDADAKAGFAFFVVLLLYGQLMTYGFWVAAGVVEEKASRVVEVVLSTIRPSHLLAGKVIGLGLLGLGNLLLVAAVGLGVAQATGALEIDGDIIAATVLSLVWFVLGYAFYACAFACAGALVPRQEELQSTTTPLTMVLLASFFLAFAVQSNPDGTLAHVTAFLPMTAPITAPPRIAAGDMPTWEIIASIVVTAGGAALLIPLAGRIYAGGVLRTGSALKLRDAWRAART
jgi:ABC-2 type transport system permease protein